MTKAMRLHARFTAALVLLGLASSSAEDVPSGSGALAPPPLVELPELGLRVARGFRITVYSGEDLANDIYAMTLDARGRVVVTSRGWVKVLEDGDGDGKADSARVIVRTESGGMGLCFDGDDLYFTGDGAFSVYRGAGRDPADGPAELPRPEPIVKLAFGEHGGHAPRKGPDGWWYVIAGNDAKVGKEHASLPDTPIAEPEAGSVLRIPPGLKGSQVVACGFRNPYDFDFAPDGAMYTYDSDTERDFLLPWYTPTRLYRIADGQHHGWRVRGYLRSYCRRDWYPDVVDILVRVGRGSPTGVVCYRHEIFPERYRGGFFFLDWTFGRVYFLPGSPADASQANLETFIEPVGASGFAPTDAAVAPDGSLYISVGGRRTRGAVYRIEPEGARASAPSSPGAEDVLAVLRAPQPLDAWSRARWEPIARRLGPKPFAEQIGGPDGLRSVEVLTEVFGGIPAASAEEAARAPSPEVRARVAWSLGRTPCEGHSAVLERLAADPDTLVRTAALGALRARYRDIDSALLVRAAASSFAHGNKGVRMAAARLASVLRPTAMRAFREETGTPVSRAQITDILASIWRGLDDASRARAVDDCLDVVSRVPMHAERRDAVRLLVFALGDWHLDKPPLEIHSMCSLPDRFRPRGESADRIISKLGSQFPSGDAALDLELSRVLAMLEAPTEELADLFVARIGPATSVSDDIHYLIVLSRLTGPLTPAAKDRIADAILSLSAKAGGLDGRPKQVWGERLEELVRALLAKHPDLGARLLAHPGFVSPPHVGFAACLAGDERREAASRFLEPALERKDWPWSEALIDLLSALPGDRLRAAIRERWHEEVALRDAIAVHLARSPEPADGPILLEGLDSASLQVVSACLGAIEALPPDGSAEGLAPLLRLRKRLLREKGDAQLLSRVAAALTRASDREIDIGAGQDPEAAHAKALDLLAEGRPELRDLLGSPAEDLEALRGTLAKVPWADGAPPRGETVFRKRCETCHAVQGALGPSLAGVTARFSRNDLFTAIADPARDVAAAFRPTLFRLADGGAVSGVVVFESADGYMVQTDATKTVRLAISEIASVAPGDGSLMPAGLLKDLGPGDLADLYAFLQNLRS